MRWFLIRLLLSYDERSLLHAATDKAAENAKHFHRCAMSASDLATADRQHYEWQVYTDMAYHLYRDTH
jgi:hypothetical protein